MAYRITVKPRAVKALEKLTRSVQRRIAWAIDALAAEPRPSGCRKIVGGDDAYRIRVGDYRVVYQIFEKIITVTIIRIGHRKEIYRRK